MVACVTDGNPVGFLCGLRFHVLETGSWSDTCDALKRTSISIVMKITDKKQAAASS